LAGWFFIAVSLLHLIRSTDGQRSASPAIGGERQLAFERLESRVVLSGSGLTAQYFHNADFTGLAVERVEAVDFNWGTASPAPGLNANSFSVRWFGQVEAEFSETYTFRTVSDEGVRLWVDGQLLVDDWTAHAVRTRTGSLALVAGQRYDVRIEYYDNSGSAQMRLQWSSASQGLEAIPSSNLYASPAGLRGEYWDWGGGVAHRLDPGVDFDWGAGAPIGGIAAEGFSVQWSGLLRPDFSEQYDFSTLSDDGVRLWIGEELIIDDWNAHPAATNVGSKVLEAGKWYDVRLEYFEATGDAQVELAWSSERQTGIGAFETIGAGHLRGAKHTPLTFTNPLGPGADPYVVQWENSYLLVRSANGSVRLNQASQLQDIHASDSESISTVVWSPPGGTNYSSQIWAPELHQLNGKWYIYVAASDGNNETHRMHVLERDNPNPMGPFTYKGQLAASADRWAIDGTVLEWQGDLYFIWSGWPGLANGQQNLYISRMSNPWTLTGGRVQISSPDLAWERHGMPINEGPQILIHDGQLHIIYSASGYWRHEYALGRLTYDGVGSIMNPASWSKSPEPVFQQSGGVVGVGHASFVASPDGAQYWNVYHAHHDPNNWQDDRDIRMQPFAFHADGTPDFGTPLPSSVVLEAPTGFAYADRPLLPGDYDASGVVDEADLVVHSATFGQLVFPGSGADGSGNGIVDLADVTVWGDWLGAVAAPIADLAPLSGASLVVAAMTIMVEDESRVENSIAAAPENVTSPGLRSYDVAGAVRVWQLGAPAPPPNERLARSDFARHRAFEQGKPPWRGADVAAIILPVGETELRDTRIRDAVFDEEAPLKKAGHYVQDSDALQEEGLARRSVWQAARGCR
jgi:GH43 family beta-xylosidase